MTNVPWPKQPTIDDDDEADRQMVLLAIAELALRRPGWDATLRRLAGRLHGEEMFDKFKETGGDVTKPMRSPIYGTNEQAE